MFKNVVVVVDISYLPVNVLTSISHNPTVNIKVGIIPSKCYINVKKKGCYESNCSNIVWNR